MKYSHTALVAMALTCASAGVPEVEMSNLLLVRDQQNIHQALAELETLKARRDVMLGDIEARESKIVTDVLAAIKDTNLAPEIIHYFATNETFQPIVISAVVALLGSGLINWKAVFDALDQLKLVPTVINQLISDCSLYVDLFNIAKGYITELLPVVKQKIQDGIELLTARDMIDAPLVPALVQRDVQLIVVSLMDSLADSGLAAQVVRDILTDTSYYPFAVSLITAVIAGGSLHVSDIISALEQLNFAGDLLKEILTADTFNTVVTNAFAAAAGKCAGGSSGSIGSGSSGSGSGSSGSSSGSSGSGSGTSTPGTGTVIKNPCKKRKRSYNY